MPCSSIEVVHWAVVQTSVSGCQLIPCNQIVKGHSYKIFALCLTFVEAVL